MPHEPDRTDGIHDILTFEIEELELTMPPIAQIPTVVNVPTHQQKMPAPLVSARTDSELARTYLARPEKSAATIENVKRELYRFLKWCREIRGKSLRGLRVEDIQAYFLFLKDPQPAAEWISPKKEPRFLPDPTHPASRVKNPAYRPFAGPLSESSQRQAQVIVKAFLKWGHKVRYLPDNPAALVDLIKPGATGESIGASGAADTDIDVCERFLTKAVIDHVLQISNGLPTTPRNARDRFLLYAYFHTGARLAEIVNAKMGAIYRAFDGRWWLRITGKGKKKRRVPVPRPMLEAFRDYRRTFGLIPDPLRTDPLPMVLSTKARPGKAQSTPVTTETGARAVIRLLELAAASAGDLDDGNAAIDLYKATTHWLRHSLFTWLVNNGMNLKRVQVQAGHNSIETTSIYLHDEANARHDDISALFPD